MYIRSLEIKNIRSIEHFEMTFPEGKEAGWHVLIGDNGSGKSTIVKSMALALLKPADVYAAHQGWYEWLRRGKEKGHIVLCISGDSDVDSAIQNQNLNVKNRIDLAWKYEPSPVPQNYGNPNERPIVTNVSIGGVEIDKLQLFNGSIENSSISTTGIDLRTGWFSVAYGPFRRFSGGDVEKDKLFLSNPRLGAHLSIFDEDVALSEALNYIRELYIKDLEKKDEWKTLESLKEFINGANLLPHGTKIDSVDSNNIYFKDGNGSRISTIQMSDGFRSILSLAFELIRQLIRSYGAGWVFSKVREGNMVIDLPGVVLVDEIDVHLHPTWQTRIGNWFLKYFPNLQFIVTTHSPLVCRACEKGSIWRLAAPGSNQESGEVTGLDRERLIYGNVLDAYGTELFGQDVERSDQSQKKLERLAHLSQLNAFGKISDPEKKEMQDLRKILITDDTTTF